MRLTAMILALAVLAGCDPVTSVHGVEVDARHNAISGAAVRLAQKGSHGFEVTSRQDGSFSIAQVQAVFEGFVLTVSKPGYVTYHVDVPTHVQEQLTIVLLKDGANGR